MLFEALGDYALLKGSVCILPMGLLERGDSIQTLLGVFMKVDRT